MNLLFLCIKIFVARILDVSIGTIRTLIMVKGKLLLTSVLAFLEALIWVLVVREALVTVIDPIWIPVSYSLGYMAGTFIGSYICKNAFRNVIGIEIIVKQNKLELIKAIRKCGFAVSVIDLKNNKNGLLLCQVNHKSEEKLIRLVKKYDENAFIVVNDTKYVQNGFIK